MVEKVGPTGLTLRSLAAEVGVTHAAPYRHFRDKAALLAAVAEQGRLELTRRVREAAQGVPTRLPNRERLDRLMAAYLDFAQGRPALYRLMHRTPPPSATDRRTAAPGLEEMLTVLQRLVEELLATRPASPRHDARQLAAVLWACLHGLTALAIDESRPAGSAEATRAAAVDTLLAGLGS